MNDRTAVGANGMLGAIVKRVLSSGAAFGRSPSRGCALFLMVGMLLVGTKGSWAQEIVWERTYELLPGHQLSEPLLYSVVAAPNGGCVIAIGRALNKSRIIKLDSQGEILWEFWTETGEYGSSDEEGSLMRHASGGYIFQITSVDSHYIHQPILIRLTEDGELLWRRNYRFGYNMYVKHAVIGDSGVVLIVGGVELEPLGYPYSFTLAIGSDGEIAGSHIYQPHTGIREGCYLGQGEFVFGGQRGSGPTVIRANSEGDSLDLKTYDLGPRFRLTEAFDLQDENTAVVGGFLGDAEGGNRGDAFLTTITLDDDILNYASYGEDIAQHDYLLDLVTLPDDKIAFCGWTNADYWMTAWLQLVDADLAPLGSIYSLGNGVAEYKRIAYVGRNEVVLLGATAVDAFSTDWSLLVTKVSLPLGVKESTADIKWNLLSVDAYPNPFNMQSRIEISVPYPQELSLELRDVIGRVTWTRPKQAYQSGTTTIDLTSSVFGGSLASGTYYLTLSDGRNIRHLSLTKLR